MAMNEELVIASRDYWVKVVDMLQELWALIEPREGNGCTVYFILGDNTVFDELPFMDEKEAKASLRRNGYWVYADDKESQEFIVPPESPFFRGEHPNGPIYSSGRFWS
jgi:hypothetical protein